MISFDQIAIISPPSQTWYSLTMLLAILVSSFYWIKTSHNDPHLPLIYVFALGCAFIGAKIAYLFAEGWLHTGEDRWIHWLSGKSVTGALIGGFIGVEACKRFLGYTRITGDKFALIVPIGIIMGRIGCLTNGCCQGIACDLPGGLTHWPAVPTEILFNLCIIFLFMGMRKNRQQTYQHFHIYLIAYSAFRFLHEFVRATPKSFAFLSGYQIITLATLILAVIAYRRRKRQLAFTI